MRKIRLLITTITLALVATIALVINGVFNKKVNNEEEKIELPEGTFIETDDADCGEFEQAFIRTNVLNDDVQTSLADKVGVQKSVLTSTGLMSLRFVILTTSTESTYTITRKLCKDYWTGKGNDERLDMLPTSGDEFVCTHRYDAIINENGNTVTAESQGYSSYFVYTLRNIPSEYWFSYLDVQLPNGTVLDANVAGLLNSKNAYYSRFKFKDTIMNSDCTVSVSNKTCTNYFIPSHKPIKKNDYIVAKGAEITRVEDFSNCKSANTIVVPTTAQTVVDDAFKGCSALTALRFERTSGWNKTVADEATNATNYKNGGTALENPTIVNDYSLTYNEWAINAATKQISQRSNEDYKYVSTNNFILLREGDSFTIKNNPYYFTYALCNASIPDGGTIVKTQTLNNKGSDFTYTHEKTNEVPYNYVFLVITSYQDSLKTKFDNLEMIRDLIVINRSNQHYDYVKVETDRVETNDIAFYGESYTTTLVGVEEVNLVVSMNGTVLTSGYTYTYNLTTHIGTLTIAKVTGTITLGQNSNIAEVSYWDVDRGNNVLFATVDSSYTATGLSADPDDLYVQTGNGSDYITLEKGVDYTYTLDTETNTYVLCVNNVEKDIRICSHKMDFTLGRNYSFDDNYPNNKANGARASNTLLRKITKNESVKLTITEGVRLGITLVCDDGTGQLKRKKDLGWLVVGEGKVLSDNTAVAKEIYEQLGVSNVSTDFGQIIEVPYYMLVTMAGANYGDEIYLAVNIRAFNETTQKDATFTQAHVTQVRNTLVICDASLARYQVKLEDEVIGNVYDGANFVKSGLKINTGCIEVKMAGNVLTKNTDYTYADGTLTVFNAKGDIQITDIQRTFDVTYTKVAAGTNKLTALECENYVATNISTNSNYLVVRMNNVVLTSGVDYSYEGTTLTVFNVNGDIEIESIQQTYSVAYNNVTYGTNALFAYQGEDYVATNLKMNISFVTITMNGVEINNYTYIDGTLTIPSTNGNIVITSSQKTYTVSYSKIDYGTNPTTAYEEDDYVATGLDIEIAYTVITMNGNTLEYGTDYTYADGTLTIYSIIANVTITFAKSSVKYSRVTKGDNPEAVITGTPFTAILTDVSADDLYIIMNNEELTSSKYTYAEGTLTISNVTGDIWISKKLRYTKGSWFDGSGASNTQSTMGTSERITLVEPVRIYDGEKISFQMLSGGHHYYIAVSTKADGVYTRARSFGDFIRYDTNTSKTLGSWVSSKVYTTRTAAETALGTARVAEMDAQKVGDNCVVSLTYKDLCILGGYNYADLPEIYISVVFSVGSDRKTDYITAKYWRFFEQYITIAPEDYTFAAKAYSGYTA